MYLHEGIPLPRPLCGWCVTQEFEDQQYASREVLVAWNGPERVVEVCERCCHTLRPIGAVGALGRPATDEDRRRFYLHNGIQVSGMEEVAEEPSEALAKAIEPPAIIPTPRASEAAQKALWSEEAEEWDGRYICITGLCMDNKPIPRTENALNDHRKSKHPGVPTVAALDVTPKFKFKCPSEKHEEWGCKRTFQTAAEATNHARRRGPDQKVIDAWKAGAARG